MAGDWIKIETCLTDKPEVMQLSGLLKIDELQVVGHLIRFWSWCDQNMSLNCPVVSGTKRGLDRVALRDGFVDAMVTVGWLRMREDGLIEVPNYEHHLSSSAKQRAQEQKKKQKQREINKSSYKNSHENVPNRTGQNRDNTGTESGPEKRREESIDKKNTKKKKAYTREFESWYATYPRKIAKASAEKAYTNAVADIAKSESVETEQAEAMLAKWSIERYPLLNQLDEQFIPHPATWLNQGRYRDAIATSTKSRVASAEDLANYNPGAWQ